MKRSLRIFATALVAVLLNTVAASAATDPSGTWKWIAEGPNGRSTESTLTLDWTNNRLTGSIDNRLGKVEIRDAKLVGNQVSFTVERKIRFRKFTVKYQGKLEGDTITGTAETVGREKKPISIFWIAKR